MAVLPNKILEDFEIEAFVDRVNTSSEKIISDNQFKISNPSLPGLGLLLKLQIRAFEKALASAFAPIFLAKKALTEGVSAIEDAYTSIRTIFESPLQFLLDEGVNSTLEEFPFPIRLEIGGGPSGGALDRLRDLLSDKKQVGDTNGSLENFNYTLVFNSNSLPLPGEITTVSSSLQDVSSITVSSTTENSESNDLIGNSQVGDKIQLSDDKFSASYTVTQVRINQDSSVTLSLTINSIAEINGNSGDVSIPGFKNATLSTERNLLLRSFIDEDGRLKIPLSALGLDLPLLSAFSVVLGDFSKLKDSSAAKQFMDRLSERSGLSFAEILSGIIEGKFPKIDFEKLQKDSLEGNTESQEKAKEEMTSLARLIQIGTADPFFLIKILFNYVKLLLLPLNVVVGVLKGLGELITGPVSLVKTLFKAITNPLGLICDLISKSFLEVLRPYIQNPILSAGMTWSEALNDPNEEGRGLQPMISDMVCGKFSRGLRDYTPNQSFFENLNRNLPNDQRPLSEGPQIPYDTLFDSQDPSPGEISVNSSDVKQITTFKISNFSNTVENSTPLLSTLNVGDEFTFSVSNNFAKYRISSKEFVLNETSPYFKLGVQYLKNAVETAQEKSIEELQKEGINFSALKSSLNVNNPDKTLLYIVEKYLPIKLVAIWQSIKGVIAIFGGLAQQVPSLFPAVLRSLFGLTQGKTKEELLALIDADKNGVGDLAVPSSIETLNLLYSGDKSLMYLGTDNESRSGSNYNVGARDTLVDLIQNSSSSNEPGIENVFYDLASSLKESGKDAAIIRDRLSTSLGENTQPNVNTLGSINSFLNRERNNGELVFAKNAPSKNDFFYGELSLIDVGNSVKVLSAIMLRVYNTYYFSNSDINLEAYSLSVYIRPADGGERVRLYSGNLYTALNGFKVTKQPVEKTVSFRDLRIIINREISFLVDFGLPSLQ
jgi:hypothetical protein